MGCARAKLSYYIRSHLRMLFDCVEEFLAVAGRLVLQNLGLLTRLIDVALDRRLRPPSTTHTPSS